MTLDHKNVDLSIQSTHSYFGSSGKIGESNDRNIERTIRTLQDERLARAASSLPSTRPPSEGVKLKTFISIGSPDPAISVVLGAYCVSFGLKTECPGRIVIIARNEISSLCFPVTDRLLVSLPIPEIDGFTIDISPDIDQYRGTIGPEFDAVTRHVLNFELFDNSESLQFTFAEHKLFVGERSYVIKVDQQCSIDPREGGPCFTCLTKTADVAIAECGHQVICSDCLCGRAVRLHHCPLCHAPTTF
jgi:hypothetical protein